MIAAQRMTFWASTAVLCCGTAVLCCGAAVSVPALGGTEFFVATQGNDRHAGTPEQPFRTLERARDALRELRRRRSLTAPVTVWIRGGYYQRTNTFELTSEDAGSASMPVTYRACGKELVRLAGGPILPAAACEPVADPDIRERLDAHVRGQVRCVNLKAHGISDYGELGGLTGGLDLFCNGRRMPLARWPNGDWALARQAPPAEGREQSRESVRLDPGPSNLLEFQFSGPAPHPWKSCAGVWLRGYWHQEYQFDAWQPVGFDAARRQITLPHSPGPQLQEWRRFYAANILEELDDPGEWYLDRSQARLYFLPPSDAETVWQVSVLADALIALHDCSHVTLRGLVLEGARGAAIVVSGGTENRVAGCVIRNVGQGVILAGGTRHHLVGCDLYDLAATAVRATGGDRATLTPGGHEIVNNHIHHYAQHLKTWYPGVRLEGVGNRVAHNWIHHAPQYAISYDGNDHLIEFNNLHDLCLEMSDVGVIGCGTDWTLRGNVIRHNFVHDIPERPYPGTAGIYLDNCASSAEIVGNVFFRTYQAVFIGGGRDNIVSNNLFIECDKPVHLDNRGLRWNHFRPDGPMYDLLKKVRHDQPPYRTRYPQLARILQDCPQAPLGNKLVRNVSVRSRWRNPEAECRATFAQHIDRPYMEIADNFVTDEDPGFVDARTKNFALRKDSMVYQKIPGFVPIPFERIGLYGDVYRDNLPLALPGHTTAR